MIEVIGQVAFIFGVILGILAGLSVFILCGVALGFALRLVWRISIRFIPFKGQRPS